MNISKTRDGKVRVVLSESTADLVQKYAELSTNGVITKYPIINEEIIGALRATIEQFATEFVVGERAGELWEKEGPCADCAEAKGCSITCRLKHNFEKEVYGGLLCGTKPAFYLLDTSKLPPIMAPEERAEWTKLLAEDADKIEGFFVVRLVDGNCLEIERSVPHKTGAVWHTKYHPLVIDHMEITLRPWSMALYRTFLNRPEGVTLASLCKENKRDLLRHYLRASDSELKCAKVHDLLTNDNRSHHLINNKISELNAELKSQGVSEIFMVRSDSFKANNKPYYIRYLKEQISE